MPQAEAQGNRKISPRLLRECDRLARSLGVTPVFNEAGIIIAIGTPEGKGRVYVVWIGRAIGLFYNWGLVKAMVAGVSGACYKKFRNLEEARAGWYNGPNSFNGDWIAPSPRPAMQTVNDSGSKTTIDAPAESTTSLTGHGLRPDGPVAVEMSHSDYELQVQPAREPDPVYVHAPPDFCEPDPDREEGEEIFVPPSPTSFPLFSPALSDGTLSLRTVATPQLPSRPLTGHVPRSSASASLPCAGPAIASGTNQPRGYAMGVGGFEVDQVAVSKPKEIFVVVRGARPGIYFDRNTAIEMLGVHPGMKLVMFDSLSRASWYFVQKYMARQVGRPVLVVEE